MELLFFTPWHPHPANPTLGNFILRQVELLRKRHMVRLLAYSTDDQYARVEIALRQEDCLHLLYNPAKLDQRLKVRKLSNAWISESRPPELLLGCIPHQSGALLNSLKRRFKVPLVMIEHWSGHLPERNTRLSLSQKYRLHQAAKSVDLLLPVTRQLGEKLGPKLGCGWMVWRNLADPDLFYRQTEKRFDYIHLSTLDPNKMPEAIVRAFSKLLEIRPGLKLSIGGDGPLESLKTQIEALGIQNSVDLHGNLLYEQAAERIRSSKCLVQFSGYENLPCVVTEALAAGIWVISSKVGGIAEVLREGENGLLVEAGNESELFEAMRQSLDRDLDFQKPYRESEPEFLLEQFDRAARTLVERNTKSRT